MDVLIAVGGTTEFAAGNRASLIRKVDGKQQRYNVRLDDLIKDGDNENFTWHGAAIDVWKNGEFLTTLEPTREFYKSSRQPVGRVIREAHGFLLGVEELHALHGAEDFLADNAHVRPRLGENCRCDKISV